MRHLLRDKVERVVEVRRAKNGLLGLGFAKHAATGDIIISVVDKEYPAFHDVYVGECIVRLAGHKVHSVESAIKLCKEADDPVELTLSTSVRVVKLDKTGGSDSAGGSAGDNTWRGALTWRGGISSRGGGDGAGGWERLGLHFEKQDATGLTSVRVAHLSGLAASSRRFAIGDYILSVNGNPVDDETTSRSYLSNLSSVSSSSMAGPVTFEVSATPTRTTQRTVRLSRHPDDYKVGLSFTRHLVSGEVVIHSIAEGYPAQGMVEVGERVLSIGGVTVSDESKAELYCGGTDSHVEMVVGPCVRNESLLLKPKEGKRGGSSSSDDGNDPNLVLSRKEKMPNLLGLRFTADNAADTAVRIGRLKGFAADSGRFAIGDYLHSINGLSVHRSDAAHAAINATPPGEPTSFEVWGSAVRTSPRTVVLTRSADEQLGIKLERHAVTADVVIAAVSPRHPTTPGLVEVGEVVLAIGGKELTPSMAMATVSSFCGGVAESVPLSLAPSSRFEKIGPPPKALTAQISIPSLKPSLWMGAVGGRSKEGASNAIKAQELGLQFIKSTPGEVAVEIGAIKGVAAASGRLVAGDYITAIGGNAVCNDVVARSMIFEVHAPPLSRASLLPTPARD